MIDVSLPVGAAVLWPAAIDPPTGWLRADGSAVSRTEYSQLFAVYGETWGPGDGSTTFNLPDGRRRSPVGAGGTASAQLGNAIGDLGGAETITLTVSTMPAHGHVQDSHNHTQDSHTHTGSFSHTHSGPLHSHTFEVRTGSNTAVTGTGDRVVRIADGQGSFCPSGTTGSSCTVTTGSGGNGNTSGAAGTFVINAATATNQATTATNQSTGGGGAHNNYHPAFVVDYIIKAQGSVSPGASLFQPFGWHPPIEEIV